MAKRLSSEYPDHPRVAVGAVVFHRNKILLVKRGQPPAQDFWAIPGGKVELGETLQMAAEREIYEETGIVVHAGDPVYIFDVVERDSEGNVRFHYVIVDLHADYMEGELDPGDDTVEARWVSPEEMPALKVNTRTRKLLKERFDFGL